MGQIRLYVSAQKAQAEQIYAAAETEFEDDGHPVAITELDEEKAVFEVSVYVDAAFASKAAQRMAKAANIPASDLQTETLPDIDWVKHSLEGLKPVRAGRFFVHGAHDRDKIKPDDLAIEIEAGQAFGTGHHGTTAGCLEMISTIMHHEQPHNVLDLGTGSGVLAIAAAKLQPVHVLATDIDPVATQVAGENIRLNGVSSFVQVVTATGFQHPEIRKHTPFNLIIANILACPLIELAPEMAHGLARGGSLVLSGILDSQRDKVLAAYQAQGLLHHQTIHHEEWVTLHLK